MSWWPCGPRHEPRIPPRQHSPPTFSATPPLPHTLCTKHPCSAPSPALSSRMPGPSFLLFDYATGLILPIFNEMLWHPRFLRSTSPHLHQPPFAPRFHSCCRHTPRHSRTARPDPIPDPIPSQSPARFLSPSPGAIGIITEHVSTLNVSGYHASDVLLVREVLPGLPLWTMNHPLMPGDVLLEADGQALTRCSDAEALAVLRRVARDAVREGGAITLTLRRAPAAIRGNTLFRPIFPSAAGRLRRRTAVGISARSALAP